MPSLHFVNIPTETRQRLCGLSDPDLRKALSVPMGLGQWFLSIVHTHSGIIHSLHIHSRLPPLAICDGLPNPQIHNPSYFWRCIQGYGVHVHMCVNMHVTIILHLILQDRVSPLTTELVNPGILVACSSQGSLVFTCLLLELQVVYRVHPAFMWVLETPARVIRLESALSTELSLQPNSSVLTVRKTSDILIERLLKCFTDTFSKLSRTSKTQKS